MDKRKEEGKVSIFFVQKHDLRQVWIFGQVRTDSGRPGSDVRGGSTSGREGTYYVTGYRLQIEFGCVHGLNLEREKPDRQMEGTVFLSSRYLNSTQLNSTQLTTFCLLTYLPTYLAASEIPSGSFNFRLSLDP
jgi:hypothetical protein